MALTIFASAERIISQIFNWLQSSGQNRSTEVVLDTFSSGIDNATSLGEGFMVVPGNNNTSSTPSVNITTGGIAYDPLANRIFINPLDVQLYDPTAPSQTTNDGLGNFLSTPQSTGVVNIPIPAAPGTYNLWVNYLATIDTSSFTLNEETNAKIFYKQTDGYNIQVNATAPNANSIFLAAVTYSGVAITSAQISQVGRTYYHILPNIVPITTPLADNSDRTPTYAPDSTYTLEAHIKAVGTGTGISPTNPHNMSLTDLGVGILDTVQEHRILEHGNAIIAGVPGTPYPTSSAMATSINIVNPGSDTINVFKFSGSEFAIINGTAFNTNAIFGAIPANATVAFPDASGTYDVYWDSVSKIFAVTTPSGNIDPEGTQLWIASVTYTFVGHGVSDHNALSGLVDRRRVGSTTHLLQRWTNNSRPGVSPSSFLPESGEFGFNLTSGTLEFWNGSTWVQPLATTAVDNTSIDLNGSNQLEVKNLGITTAKIAAGAVSQFVLGGTAGVGDQTTIDESLVITTTGGSVLIFGALSMQIATGGSPTTMTLAVTRGGTALSGNSSLASVIAGSTVVVNTSCMTIDTPIAGTYTYRLSHGYTLTPAELTRARSFMVIELKK